MLIPGVDVFVDVLLWSSLLGLGYAYVGYPLILAVWSLFRGRPVARGVYRPTVTIVIAASNEAKRLPDRLRNCLEQDYPSSLLNVVVVSDGSTDDTVAAIDGQFAPKVAVVELERHYGKAVALNHGVAVARGDVIVFTDARQRFASTAISELVSNFGDPHVGAVSGELVLEAVEEGEGFVGVGLYWRMEKWIRRKESEIDSVVGVTGAIYAVRRSLWKPLPPGTILDDVLVPMQIAARGYRVVFEHRALAFDRLAQDYEIEFRRKVRTLAGNYQALSLAPELLSPWRNRLFFQFFSHKLCRLAAPFCLLALLFANIFRMDGWLYYLLLTQAAAYAAAIAGWYLTSIGIRERYTASAFTFCLLNFAALVGAKRFLVDDEIQWSRTS